MKTSGSVMLLPNMQPALTISSVPVEIKNITPQYISNDRFPFPTTSLPVSCRRDQAAWPRMTDGGMTHAVLAVL